MAIYNPPLKSYAPLYIQREDDVVATDIRTVYGVTVLQQDFPLQLKVKQPYKNDWKDRHGDDEYLDNLFYEAISYSMKCVMFTDESTSDIARATMKEQLYAFREFIGGGAFKIYSDWTKMGFQNCRLEEFPEASEDDFTEMDGHCRLIFNVKIKINDPVTVMELSSGSIVEAE